MTAETIMDALASLFARHGEPLVLKSDNVSGFQAHGPQCLLDETVVHFLPTPSKMAWYNSASEPRLRVGIGSTDWRSDEWRANEFE